MEMDHEISDEVQLSYYIMLGVIVIHHSIVPLLLLDFVASFLQFKNNN